MDSTPSRFFAARIWKDRTSRIEVGSVEGDAFPIVFSPYSGKCGRSLESLNELLSNYAGLGRKGTGRF